jgi:hypothetical protein
MANEQNLNRAGRALTSEEASRIGKIGAARSAESRRRRKLFRETIADMLKRPCADEELCAALDALGLPNDLQSAMVLRQIMIAVAGDKGATDAFKAIRDSVGERPAEQVQVTAGIDPAQDDLRQLSDDQLDALEAEFREE